MLNTGKSEWPSSILPVSALALMKFTQTLELERCLLSKLTHLPKADPAVPERVPVPQNGPAHVGIRESMNSLPASSIPTS